jgi:hypothetical protein
MNWLDKRRERKRREKNERERQYMDDFARHNASTIGTPESSGQSWTAAAGIWGVTSDRSAYLTTPPEPDWPETLVSESSWSHNNHSDYYVPPSYSYDSTPSYSSSYSDSGSSSSSSDGGGGGGGCD